MKVNSVDLVPIFGMIFVGWAIYLRYQRRQLNHKEKIDLIEKGMDPSLANEPMYYSNSYKNGLLLIGAAFGILTGYIINLKLGIPDFIAYACPILLFCGILLVYFHKSQTK